MISFGNLLRLWRGKTIKRFPVRMSPGTPVHDLAIATTIRNEAKNLVEWIDFHLAQGVAHFYIFDNESTDDTAAVLEPYTRAGLVTVTPWPHRKGYHANARAYAHALTVFGAKCRWIAMIDVDEFLYCPQGRKLPDVLGGLSRYPALIVHRHTYGTSGHLTPPGGVIGHYHMRIPAPDGPFEMKSNLAPKSIVQPGRVAAVNGSHTCILKGTAVIGHDETGEALTGRQAPAFRDGLLRIDHFYTKDRQTFLSRITRGRTVSNRVFPASRWHELLKGVEDHATVHDDTILKVLPPDWQARHPVDQTAALRERPSSVISAP